MSPSATRNETPPRAVIPDLSIPLPALLASSEFPSLVKALGHEFRQAHSLPPVHQLGFVVADVQKASSDFEALGVQSFYILEGNTAEWSEHGEKRTVRGKIGLSYFKGYELELIEPATGTDFYRGPSGRTIALHHLGFRVDDVDESGAKLAAAGFSVCTRGRLEIGPLTVEFAYVDTLRQAGLFIEFISWTILGRLFTPHPDLWRRETLEKLIRKKG